MTEDDFWSMIELVDRKALWSQNPQAAIEPVVKRLSEAPAHEIQSFEEHLAKALYDLDGQEYFEEAGASKTDDTFLYARCFIVGAGREHYDSIRLNPAKWPKDKLYWFELLLSAGYTAWSRATGRDESEWDYETEYSFETGCNTEAWDS